MRAAYLNQWHWNEQPEMQKAIRASSFAAGSDCFYLRDDRLLPLRQQKRHGADALRFAVQSPDHQ